MLVNESKLIVWKHDFKIRLKSIYKLVNIIRNKIINNFFIKIERNNFLIKKVYKMVVITENLIFENINRSVLNLKNKNITSIKIDDFSSLYNLTDLDLSNNRLRYIGLEFSNPVNLKRLDLSRNLIKIYQ